MNEVHLIFSHLLFLEDLYSFCATGSMVSWHVGLEGITFNSRPTSLMTNAHNTLSCKLACSSWKLQKVFSLPFPRIHMLSVLSNAVVNPCNQTISNFLLIFVKSVYLFGLAPRSALNWFFFFVSLYIVL